MKNKKKLLISKQKFKNKNKNKSTKDNIISKNDIIYYDMEDYKIIHKLYLNG